jgi:hypothetical protein
VDGLPADAAATGAVDADAGGAGDVALASVPGVAAGLHAASAQVASRDSKRLRVRMGLDMHGSDDRVDAADQRGMVARTGHSPDTP